MAFAEVQQFFHYFTTGIDSQIDEWPLMSNPNLVFGIVAAYVAFVLHFGPKFMEGRKPYDLKWFIVAYNAFQVIYSGAVIYLLLSIENFGEYYFKFGCKPFPQQKDKKVQFILSFWLYVIAKVTDLLDTCFFILRKKQNQISFLHVYHHAGALFFGWCILKYSIGMEYLVIVLLNSLVHVIMYFYYFLAAFGPRFRRFLWWKKYLTRLQLVQFVFIFGHMMVALITGCSWHKPMLYFVLLNTLFHLYLFLDFYKRAYKKQENLEKIKK